MCRIPLNRSALQLYRYGAYSVSFAGWKDSLHHDLRQALQNCDDNEGPTPAHIPTVRMAGECMCDDMNGSLSI